MKDIKWTAACHVVPATPDDEVLEQVCAQNDGEDPDNMANAKEFVFIDQESGEVYHYLMTGKFASDIGRQLKMSNKSLVEHLQEEANRMRARQKLAGNGGNIPTPPEARKAANDILKGVHRKEEE